MFPTVSHFLEYLLGINLPLPFNTFGVFVALAFVAGYWAITEELKRKEKLGVIHVFKKKELIGLPASNKDIILNGLFGFVIGYKLLYALRNYTEFVNDAQTILLSLKGDLIGGVLLAALFAYWDIKEKKKLATTKPKEVEVTVHPYQAMSSMVVWAAIFGFLGAKIFDNLEYWDDFIQNPIERLLAFSGLTFYGGLICGGLAVLYIAKQYKIKAIHMLDIGAPGLMLAYAVGRVGCHLSGDGDWGIVNTNPKPFSWMPDWLWAYSYPNNVVNEGERIVDCVGRFCHELVPAVYPTPLYEAIVCFILFALLWKIKDKITIPGLMFGIYLILNGIERFSIELIRVNSKYHVGGLSFTQAELISSIMVISGIALCLYVINNKRKLG